MTGLITMLRRRIETNAQHAVEIYTKRLDEYRTMADRGCAEIGVFDLAVLTRRRTLDLAPARQPLHDDDLAAFTTAGRIRAEAGLTISSQHEVLGLHTRLLLAEITEAASTDQASELLQLIGWLGVQGTRARTAYLHGYVAGVGPARTRAVHGDLLARALLDDEPVEPFVLRGLGVCLAEEYLVCVLRVPAPQPSADERAELDQRLARRRIPAVWLAPDELVLLAPGTDASAREQALAHVRHTVAELGRPSQLGAVGGPTGKLAGCLTAARELCRVAPAEPCPARLYSTTDLFVELSVAGSPHLDAWLRGFADRLATGPASVATLNAYYRNDLNRAAAAAALNIHPRTLDYRLHRVRTATGLDPGSTAGVRVLSAAVARILSGGWAQEADASGREILGDR